MAGFFQIAGGCSTCELIDAFSRRYGWTVEEIEQLDIALMCDLYAKIREDRRRDQAYEQWLHLLPWMTAGQIKAMDFKEYYDRVSGQNLDLRPAAEILAEAEQIRKEVEGTNGTV